MTKMIELIKVTNDLQVAVKETGFGYELKFISLDGQEVRLTRKQRKELTNKVLENPEMLERLRCSILYSN